MYFRMIFALSLVLFNSSHTQGWPETQHNRQWTVHSIEFPNRVFSGGTFAQDLLWVTDLKEGSILQFTKKGELLQEYSGLPVGVDILGDPTGPYKIQWYQGTLYLTQGWKDAKKQETLLDHALLRFTPPASFQPVSNLFWNPYGFLRWKEHFWVVDASRNALMKVEPNGDTTVFHQFSKIQHQESHLSDLSPTEFQSSERYYVDAVPTGIALHEEELYVTLFGGFPFLKKGGQIYAISLHDPARKRLVRQNLNAPVDIEFGEDGRMYVLEYGVYQIGKGFLPRTGRLLVIDLITGEQEVFTSSLSFPATIALNGKDFVIVQLTGTLLFFQHRGK